MAGKLSVELADDGDILVSVGVLSKLPNVQVSERAITDWVRDGLPFVKSGKRRLFPVSKSLKWMFERGKIEVDVEAFDGIDREQMPPDLRDKLASAELKEFKLKKERGFYIEKDEVERQAFEIGKKTKESLKTIAARVADELASLNDPHQIRERIDTEINRVLEDLSKDIEGAV